MSTIISTTNITPDIYNSYYEILTFLKNQMSILYDDLEIPIINPIVEKNIKLESRVIELEATIQDLQKKLEENTNVTQELLHFLKHNLQIQK